MVMMVVDEGMISNADASLVDYIAFHVISILVHNNKARCTICSHLMDETYFN